MNTPIGEEVPAASETELEQDRLDKEAKAARDQLIEEAFHYRRRDGERVEREREDNAAKERIARKEAKEREERWQREEARKRDAAKTDEQKELEELKNNNLWARRSGSPGSGKRKTFHVPAPGGGLAPWYTAYKIGDDGENLAESDPPPRPLRAFDWPMPSLVTHQDGSFVWQWDNDGLEKWDAWMQRQAKSGSGCSIM